MRALWDNSRRWCDDQRAVSKLIRGSTESDISHAMIYVDDHWITDATAEGVQSRNTLRLFFPDDCSVNVKRLKGGLTDTDALAICHFARARIVRSTQQRRH